MTNGAINGRDAVDTSAGSPNDLLMTTKNGIVQNRHGENSTNTHATVIQAQLSYGVVGGFGDAVGEMTFQHVSGIARVDNRCEWKTWISGRVTDNALMAENEVERDALIGHDSDRIAQTGFLKIPLARNALIKELVWLTRPGRDGAAAMEIVPGYDKQYQSLRRNFPIVVIREKTPNAFKARLVSRGDLVSEDDVACDPTPNSVIIRTVICASLLFNLRIGNVDVAQAFPQSDTVAFPDRQIISVPCYIKLPKSNAIWGNAKYRNLNETDFIILDWEEWSKSDKKSDFNTSLMKRKPLYGGRDAPLRWFVTASRILRTKGWRQLRSD